MTRPQKSQDGHSPLMLQYNEIKRQHPDKLVFYRMGDFYELFGDDAREASSILGITLTSRAHGKDTERIPLAGVPHQLAYRTGRLTMAVARRLVRVRHIGLANLILEAAPDDLLRSVKIGAVGLGSSNDFHKPLRLRETLLGIPCKTDFDHAVPRDVGEVTVRQPDGRHVRRYWLLNASLGVTARGNSLFNHPDIFLAALKRHAPSTAILVSALRAIRAFRGVRLDLRTGDGTTRTTLVSNLAVVKSPHFTGGLRYDSRYEPRSGRFNVHLYPHISRMHTVRLLWGLAHGRFSSLKWSQTWSDSRLAVSGDDAFDVELDGEVMAATRAEFSVASRRLQVCP